MEDRPDRLKPQAQMRLRVQQEARSEASRPTLLQDEVVEPRRAEDIGSIKPARVPRSTQLVRASLRDQGGREIARSPERSGRIRERQPLTFPAGTTTLMTEPYDPPERKPRWIGPAVLFLLMVLAPFGGLVFFLYHVASPQYAAEFRFTVQEITPAVGMTTPAVPSGTNTNLSSLATAMSAGTASSTAKPAVAQDYIVVDYLKSRDIVDQLQAKLDLRKMFSRSDIDPWFRLDADASPEELLDFWRKMVSADYDMITGLAKATIKAFRPDDALRVTKAAVALSENLVNHIQSRSQQDSVKFAEAEVARAKVNLDRMDREMAAFRDKEGTIDPTNATGDVTSNVNLATSLATTLAQDQAALTAMLAQKLRSDSPQVRMQIATVNAAKAQLARVQGEVSTSRSGGAVLSRVVSEYEALLTDRQYAQALLLNAYQSLDRARTSAATQVYYLVPYVEPALPVSARGLGSVRFRYLTIAGLALVTIWTATVMLLRRAADRKRAAMA